MRAPLTLRFDSLRFDDPICNIIQQVHSLHGLGVFPLSWLVGVTGFLFIKVIFELHAPQVGKSGVPGVLFLWNCFKPLKSFLDLQCLPPFEDLSNLNNSLIVQVQNHVIQDGLILFEVAVACIDDSRLGLLVVFDVCRIDFRKLGIDEELAFSHNYYNCNYTTILN